MRRLFVAALPFLFLFTPALHAGDKPADTPTVIVRVKSVNALLQNLGLVVKLVGQENSAQQIEAVIKSKVGKKGIEGIDPTRPLGAYLRYGKEIGDVQGAILIPIADQASFLTLIDNLGLKVKEDNGIYTHRTAQNVDLYFRFANQYLYLTGASAESLKRKVLPDPAKLLAVSGDATLSILARIDQIPDATKIIALIKVQEAIDAAKKEDLPNETKVQKEFRQTLLDDLNKMTQATISQSAEVRFDLEVFEKTREITAHLRVAGKPNSDLTRAIAALGAFKSQISSIQGQDVAFNGTIHAALPESLKSAFARVIDEAADESLKGIQQAEKKKQAEALFKAIMPSVKAGEYHVQGAVLGPKEERYTFLGAIQLKGGNLLGTQVQALIVDALKQIPEAERDKVKLDFDAVGAVKIHRFEVPKNAQLDPLIEEVIRDKYLYLAFRDDALFLALGKDALPTLKGMLAKSDAAPSPPLRMDVNVARLAKWLARTPNQRAQADKLISSGEDSRIQVQVEGGADLRVQVRLHFQALEFLLKGDK